MTMTTTEANNYLNTMRGTTFASWSPYVCAFTADPTVSGSFTNELTGGSYARQAVTFAAPSSKAVSNSAQVAFSATPGTVITHVGLADASSAGVLRRYVALGASVTVGTSGQVTIAASALTDTAT